jgi:hypothetical protein
MRATKSIWLLLLVSLAVLVGLGMAQPQAQSA